ncbi:MAG: Outer membrane protein assembly factor BamA precursor [Candidatus Omnitrophica bacterium ADurb.Bin292]|jgi:outer membrane protein insertion porin family|nr:MAG: Outer membrane protein assembly factor BamA precursor [Candidatus Omnitrophica bacterium ADurb.Bin292]HPW76354.1 outer membrane protein assembly factor BamA [Candidatus Omnitrophota bacterium]HQB11449.1 outer membrane protein assembly factor BamA [Candidatus Omnitrophota bacterium]
MKRIGCLILAITLMMTSAPLHGSEELVASSADSPAPQAPAEAKKIAAIEVRGNKIVSTATILSKIQSQPGSPLRQQLTNEDIKRLYDTGFFQDVRFDVTEIADGYKLIVQVDEKPIIRRIEIQGNTVFKEDKLRKTLGVMEGQILDQKAVKKGETEIRQLYANKGFRFIDIQTEIVTDPQTRESIVTMKIFEGKKFKIKEVRFEGNQSFSSKQLAKLMKTRPQMWVLFGTFKEEVFEKDLERISFHYQKEGYLDVKVVPEFDYLKEKNQINILIKIEEGQHYVTGEVRFKGNTLFPESELWQELEMLPGLTYSQFYVSQDMESIRNFYASEGYIEARVAPDVVLNRETGKVDVTYEIAEGELFFVEKVQIRGNTKTRDKVIRRELRIRPGERFDGAKIEKSKQRLENLGYFEEITYDTEPTDVATNRRDLIFRVKEKRTGELSFGGGVSSIDTFMGFAEISQRNFDLFNWPRLTGGGQTLSLRGQIGTINQQYDFNFIEPYLFDKPITMDFNTYYTVRDDYNVDFKEKRFGISEIFSHLFKDVFRVGGGYVLERVKLDDIASDAPQDVLDFAGKNWLSRVRAFAVYDNRDNVFNPTKGRTVNVGADLVGSFLGGDQDYYILRAGYTEYMSLRKNHLVEFQARIATAQDFGDSTSVPVFDRFYAGGLGTVRGYGYRRVSPKQNDNPVGGQTMAIINLDYSFPIPKLDMFRGVVFADAGMVNKSSYDLSFGDVVVSVGPGIKVKTPIGPLAFYYGFPLVNKDTEDENGRFEFSLSRSF